jgi:hypothetical protein
MSDQPANTVVHFFWNNGWRYVAWVPGRTYFKTATTDQYVAIKDLLNKSNIPYWERNGYDVDCAIYGTEVVPDALGAVTSITGGTFSQPQMLAFIDHHVNVGIPDQIRALEAKVDALSAATSRSAPLYRLIRDAATGAVYAYAPGVFFHIIDGNVFADLEKDGLIPGGGAITESDVTGCAAVREAVGKGIGDLYVPSAAQAEAVAE